MLLAGVPRPPIGCGRWNRPRCRRWAGVSLARRRRELAQGPGAVPCGDPDDLVVVAAEDAGDHSSGGGLEGDRISDNMDVGDLKRWLGNAVSMVPVREPEGSRRR